MSIRQFARCLSGSSAAATSKAFVQLAGRRALSTQAQAPMLDFLVPFGARFSVRKQLKAPQGQQRRHFRAGPRLRETKCIVNPREDEDGVMAMEITPRAAHRLNQIATKDKNPDLALRITVESGGCHGFQYLMSLTTLPSSTTTTTEATASSEHKTELTEDDTVFAFIDPETNAEKAGAKIVMDEPSLELLKGSKVDYTMELIGSQFKIVDNPKASSSCGCGTSFDVKF